MAAISLLMPSLGLWNSRPKRNITHTPRYSVRRRQRITPPIPSDLNQRLKVDRELEILQGDLS